MTLIIGKRSNLSEVLSTQIKDSILISSSHIQNDLDQLLKESNFNNVNVIFNNFQSSASLNNNLDPESYITNSILHTAKVLSYLLHNKISVNKIIYTSSSSVYGNNKFCSENDQVKPINLQGILKVANEELIKRFCLEQDIPYTIVRIFNMFGGNDNFSVISKIKKVYLSNTALTIINNGMAIRDYVHVNDVAKVYDDLLTLNHPPKILNVANGNAKRVYDIINALQQNGIVMETKNIYKDEISASVADISLLSGIVNTDNFIHVEDYLLEELKK